MGDPVNISETARALNEMSDHADELGRQIDAKAQGLLQLDKQRSAIIVMMKALCISQMNGGLHDDRSR